MLCKACYIIPSAQQSCKDKSLLSFPREETWEDQSLSRSPESAHARGAGSRAQPRAQPCPEHEVERYVFPSLLRRSIAFSHRPPLSLDCSRSHLLCSRRLAPSSMPNYVCIQMHMSTAMHTFYFVYLSIWLSSL